MIARVQQQWRAVSCTPARSEKQPPHPTSPLVHPSLLRPLTRAYGCQCPPLPQWWFCSLGVCSVPRVSIERKQTPCLRAYKQRPIPAGHKAGIAAPGTKAVQDFVGEGTPSQGPQ